VAIRAISRDWGANGDVGFPVGNKSEARHEAMLRLLTAIVNQPCRGGLVRPTGRANRFRPDVTDKETTMAEQRHTGSPGNFAEDREKASRAGHTGGQHSSGDFAQDRERASEAGRKGGPH
jgi:general stress protein YciG